MASIMGFSIKSLKEESNKYSCTLYYENKKVGKLYKDNNFFIQYTKYGEKIKNILHDKVEEYFQIHPRYIEEKYNEYGLAIIELVDDLISLTKIEKKYIKNNEKEKSIIIQLMYYDKKVYNNEKKEQIISFSIDCSNNINQYIEKFIKIYKPISYNIYDNLNCFDILK